MNVNRRAAAEAIPAASLAVVHQARAREDEKLIGRRLRPC